ncbi:MAG: DUF4956 domain-containing protein [Lachnospiraceae bacterium]|nr:DUF4956 domain-containing protein [Lachnospiraceae bacterium]
MFTSIFDTTTDVLSVENTAILMGAALLLGLIVAVVYVISNEKYTKGFAVSLVLLPILVETVILMTYGSLGTAVAVAGTFSLVRFRSAPGTAKEIVSIFFSMAIGLACGMGEIGFAVVLTVVVAAVFLVLMKTPFAREKRDEKLLKIMIPEDLDYTEIFDDLFEQYTKKHTLDRVKTVNLGSMYELVYTVVLKNESEEKRMLDDIRVRNGNLTVVCARAAESAVVL